MPTFSATTGPDTLAGTAGADTLIGLAGNDTYLVNTLGDVVVEAAGGGVDTIETSVLDVTRSYSLLTWAQVENLRYVDILAATLIGNGLSNRIEANAASTTADHLSGGAGNDSLFGFGGADMLVGGSGDDVLDGGTGADRMIGGAGSDIYVIDNSGDRIAEFTGGGHDLVRSSIGLTLGADWAGEVEDLTYTGPGAATLSGNDLNNVILSQGAGADALSGGAGNDTLSGGGGADTLSGGTGDDHYLVDVTDVVVEAAGAGRDTYEGLLTAINLGGAATTIENLIHTGTGAATLTGNDLSNVIEGGSGAETLLGGLGDDTLAGGDGLDRLTGGDGNDWLFGGAIPGLTIGRDRVNDQFADSLEGGAGSDRYIVSDTRDSVTELVGEGTLDVVVSGVSNLLSRYLNVEGLVLEDGSAAYSATGSGLGDILIGNQADNLVSGGLGNDTLSGWGLGVATGASDVLLGGGGDDILLAHLFAASTEAGLTLDGGAGNDLYVLGPGVAVAGWDAGGSDTALIFGTGSVARLAGVETIYLSGAGGSPDSVARSALAVAYAAASGGSAFDPDTLLAGRDAIGNDLANTIFGNSLANTLSGGKGNDTIQGGNGADTLIGGAGIDLLVGGRGDDIYQLDSGDLAVEAAGGGFDIILSATITSGMALAGFANVEGLLFTGSIDVSLNRGAANTTNDFLGGGSGNDTVLGFGGADSLQGGAGNDQVSGDLGDDVLDGGSGADTLAGGAGRDSLDGGAGADVLTGDDGYDTLIGGSGNDTLTGGGNNDRMIGGAGDDLLHFGELSQTAEQDHVFGDDPDNPALFGADEFRCSSLSVANMVTETFNGSGIFHFAGGTTVGDFQPGVDRIGVASSFVGDTDTGFDGASVVFTAGTGFTAADELVFFRADVATDFTVGAGSAFDPILASSVVSVIGNGDAALAINTTWLFVLDDGTDSAIFLFQSNNGDAAVTIDELYLIAVVTGEDALQAADLFLF